MDLIMSVLSVYYKGTYNLQLINETKISQGFTTEYNSRSPHTTPNHIHVSIEII